jgi:hypothetical protein
MNWEEGGKRSPKKSDWSSGTMQPFFKIGILKFQKIIKKYMWM